MKSYSERDREDAMFLGVPARLHQIPHRTWPAKEREDGPTRPKGRSSRRRRGCQLAPRHDWGNALVCPTVLGFSGGRSPAAGIPVRQTYGFDFGSQCRSQTSERSSRPLDHDIAAAGSRFPPEPFLPSCRFLGRLGHTSMFLASPAIAARAELGLDFCIIDPGVDARQIKRPNTVGPCGRRSDTRSFSGQTSCAHHGFETACQGHGLFRNRCTIGRDADTRRTETQPRCPDCYLCLDLLCA